MNPDLSGWKCVGYPTIMDGLVLRFRFKERPHANEPEINASRDGVSFCGAWPVMDRSLIVEVRAVIDLASKAHDAIARSGHDANLSFIEAESGIVIEYGKL